MTSGPNQNFDHAVAYIMSRFPKVTETFILREILELERQGVRLIILPLLKEQSKVVHPEVDEVRSPVHYTPLVSWEIVKANLHYVFASPFLYLRVLWKVLVGNWGSANLFVGALGIFPKSVYFARYLSRTNVRHIHAHFATHPALSAHVIASLTGLRFSFTVHAHDIFVHTAMLGEKLDAAEFVVSISEFNKKYISDRFPTAAHKIEVVHCGINPENYSRKLAVDTAAPSKEFSLVTVASLQIYKGLEYLIKACALLTDTIPGLKCTVIGEGPERESLMRMIDNLGLKGVVGLVGAKSQSEVAAHLANCDLFVLPSIVAPDGQMEGIPVALMEAMATELPVVSTEISGIPELVRHGETGLLVAPGDEVALSEAIAELFTQPELRERMGAAGRRVVERDFDLASNVRKLNSLFEDSLNSSQGLASDHIECACDISSMFEGKVISAQPAVSSGRDSKVMVVTVRTDDGTDEDVVVKFHTPASSSNGDKLASGLFHAENEYRALQRLWPEFHQEKDHLHVPKPLALIPERAAVVTERCKGVRLDLLLRHRSIPYFGNHLQLTKTFEAVGKWLGRFHSVTSDDGASEGALRRLKSEFARDLSVCRKQPFERALLDAAENYFERNFQILADNYGPVVSEHCDFGPHNIFVDGEEITLIDFEGMRDGFIYADLAYFVCLIDVMPLHHLTSRQKTHLKEAFFAGYGSDQKLEKDVLQFYEIPTLIKLAAHNPAFEGASLGDKLRAHMLTRAYTRRLKDLVK